MFWAAFSNNPTLGRNDTSRKTRFMKKQNSKKTIYGIITLYDTFFQRILVRTGFLEHIFQRLQFSVSISEEISMIQV